MELYTKHNEVVKWEIKMALLYPSCMPKSDSLLDESNNTPLRYKKRNAFRKKRLLQGNLFKFLLPHNFIFRLWFDDFWCNDLLYSTVLCLYI